MTGWVGTVRAAKMCKAGAPRPVRVPEDCATVAEAINQLPFGGRVVLAPGTHWLESTLQLSRPIELMGGAPAAQVLLLARGVTAIRVAGARLVLMSLTIRTLPVLLSAHWSLVTAQCSLTVSHCAASHSAVSLTLLYRCVQVGTDEPLDAKEQIEASQAHIETMHAELAKIESRQQQMEKAKKSWFSLSENKKPDPAEENAWFNKKADDANAAVQQRLGIVR